MLRVIRLLGIVVFSLVFGYSANVLYRMYESGRLFEQYNSQRKANITLLAFSMIALGSLGAFELRGLRRKSEMRRYGDKRYTDQGPSPTSVTRRAVSNIYDAPQTIDDWQGQKTARSSPRKHRPASDMSESWLTALRIACGVLPFAAILGFVMLYRHGFGQTLAPWIIPALCSGYILVAATAAAGVFLRRTWGLSAGYLLAILNLVLFPVGTAIGLLLLTCLVGSSPGFAQRSTRSRQSMRGFV